MLKTMPEHKAFYLRVSFTGIVAAKDFVQLKSDEVKVD
jgi:hypothetical protein